MTAFRPFQINGISDLGELLRRLEEYDRNNGAILNRGIRFEDNFDAVSITYTSNAVADTEDTVTHTLGKVPTGFIVYSINKGGVVYLSGTAATKTNIYLKCSTTSTAVKAWIF